MKPANEEWPTHRRKARQQRARTSQRKRRPTNPHRKNRNHQRSTR